MLNFEEFMIKEYMGFSEKIEKLSNYIISYLEDKDNLSDIEHINIDSKFYPIKEIIIEFEEDLVNKEGKYGEFNPIKSDYEKGIICLKFDSNFITHGKINHELFHGFEWLKNKGKDLISNLEMLIISTYNYYREKNNEKILRIINIFYILSDAEIRSHYNEAIFDYNQYKKNNKKNNNVNDLIKETDFYENYLELKEFDFDETFNNLTKKELDEFISIVELFQELKNGEEGVLKTIKHDKQYQEKFINKLKIIYNKQRNKFMKAFGRLKSIFNN